MPWIADTVVTKLFAEVTVACEGHYYWTAWQHLTYCWRDELCIGRVPEVRRNGLPLLAEIWHK